MSEVILILIPILIPIPTPFLQCLCREPLDNADNTGKDKERASRVVIHETGDFVRTTRGGTRKEATDRPAGGVWNEGMEW